MAYLLLNNLWIKLFSPLDQFGFDSLFDSFIIDFIDSMIITKNFFYEIKNALSINDFFNIINIIMLIIFINCNILFDDNENLVGFLDLNLFLTNLQTSIFNVNLLGMISGVDTISSEALFSFTLSITIILILIIFGFGLHSVRYFSILYPTGTPVVVAPFIIIIEIVSFLARAVSLGMRLFANMFAGHSLVKILTAFLWTSLISVFPLTSFIIFSLLIMIFFLECGIAYLQSYVFITLSSMYLDDTISLGGH